MGGRATQPRRVPPIEHLHQQRDARGRVVDRRYAAHTSMTFIGEPMAGQTAFIVHVFHVMCDASIDLTEPHTYQPTGGVQLYEYRRDDGVHRLDDCESLEVIDVGGMRDHWRARQRSVLVLCYNVADADWRRKLDARLKRLRQLGGSRQSALLLGLQCDAVQDSARQSALDDACALTERYQLHCFGTDYARLPIAYEEWAGGRMPGTQLSATDADAARSACKYDARIDWREACRRRLGTRGSGSIVHAPVIEVSTRELTMEQRAWLRDLLHELAVEDMLMARAT